MAPSTPEHGPKRLGDFEIVRELGRGGMGVVYQAVDKKLDRQVAIKVLPESLAGDRDRQERFRREAKLSFCFDPTPKRMT